MSRSLHLDIGKNRLVSLLKICVALLACTLTAAPLLRAQTIESVKLAARLQSDRVPLNGQIILTVEARWLGKPGAITIDAIDEPRLTNLKLLETATSNQVFRENGGVVTKRVYEYTLSGETFGMAYIDVMQLRYTDADGQSHRLQAPRLSVQVVDPIAGPLQNYSLPIALAGIVVLLAIPMAILQLHARKKRKEQAQLHSHVEQSLEQRYNERLRREVDVHAENLSEQYQKIAYLLRSYLHDALEVETRVATTDELLNKLHEQKIALESITVVQEILQTCDVQKFSGGSGDPGQLSRLFLALQSLLQEPILTKQTKIEK